MQRIWDDKLVKRVKKDVSAAAQSLLELQHVEDGASSASPQKEELSVGSQSEIDSLHREGMATQLQHPRVEKNDLKQQAAVSELTLEIM